MLKISYNIYCNKIICDAARRINNCVGERNQKFFIQFLVYVGMLAIYALGLVIASWILDCSHCNNEVAVKQSREYVYYIIFFLQYLHL